MMNLRDAGRENGRQAAARLPKDYLSVMQRDFAYLLALYPSVGQIDVAAAICDFDRERLASTPDYTRLPELRGLIERHLGEREGFREASGLDETVCAYHFSWHWFVSRRINAHHLARYDLLTPAINCTNVFFPHGREGVTISDNRDDVPQPWYRQSIPNWRPAPLPALQPHELHWVQGGVSSACLFDEEPACLFPCNPHQLLPDECRNDIHAIVEFMTRYSDFWGPGNQIWVDRQLNAVAVEKTNCRVAYRWPTVNGATCITACSYLDPGLNAFKREGTLRAMQIKGETPETSTDYHYFEGADRRQRRLIELTNQEAQRGTTIWGALAIVADEAVPFPDRICLAGQKTFPDREPNANWSLTQNAAVVTGPRRRHLYRSIQDLINPRSITHYPVKLLPGEGVALQADWQDEIARSLCILDDRATAPVG